MCACESSRFCHSKVKLSCYNVRLSVYMCARARASVGGGYARGWMGSVCKQVSSCNMRVSVKEGTSKFTHRSFSSTTRATLMWGVTPWRRKKQQRGFYVDAPIARTNAGSFYILETCVNTLGLRPSNRLFSILVTALYLPAHFQVDCLRALVLQWVKRYGLRIFIFAFVDQFPYLHMKRPVGA